MRQDRPPLKAALIHAASVLLDNGLEAVSLRRVASAAGVSPMAPYRHFADKAALLGAVAEQGFDELGLRLEAADASCQGREALIAQGLAYIAFALERPALFRLMFSTPGLACLPPKARDGAYRVLAHRVEALFPQEPEAMTTGCWALVHGLATLALDSAIPPQDLRLRAVLGAMLPPATAPSQ